MEGGCRGVGWGWEGDGAVGAQGYEVLTAVSVYVARIALMKLLMERLSLSFNFAHVRNVRIVQRLTFSQNIPVNYCVDFAVRQTRRNLLPYSCR